MFENRKNDVKPENEKDEKLIDVTGGVKIIPGNNEDIFGKETKPEDNPFLKAESTIQFCYYSLCSDRYTCK